VSPPILTPLVAALALLLGDRQPLPPPAAPAAAPESTADAGSPDLSNLLVLPGTEVEVRYAPDALDRAARLQMRLDALHKGYARLLRTPLRWKGMVLDAERWRRAGLGVPWGLPGRLGSDTFVAPARGDAESVARMRRLLGGALPTAAETPLFGTDEEAASLEVSDVLLQLDLARSFVATGRIWGDAPWVTGVLVHLAARYGWEGTEPQRVLAIVSLFDRMAAVRGGAGAHRLDDYRDGLPFEVDLWYEAQFVRGADAIWVAEGSRGTARLLKKLARSGEPARRSELEGSYPALLAWERSAFAP